MRHGLNGLEVTSRVLIQNPDLNLKDNVEIVVGLDVVQSNHTGCIVGPIVSTGFPIADKGTEECSLVTCASFTWCSSPAFWSAPCQRLDWEHRGCRLRRRRWSRSCLAGSRTCGWPSSGTPDGLHSHWGLNTWFHTRLNSFCQKPVCIGVGAVPSPLKVFATNKTDVHVNPISSSVIK